MKKYLLPMLAAACLLAGCTNEDPEPAPDPNPPVVPPDPGPGPGPEENPYVTGVDKSIPFHITWDIEPDEDYSFLGYGYDMTGKFAHPVSVRGKILDVAKYEEDMGGGVIKLRVNSSGLDNYFWGDIEECRNDFSDYAGFDPKDTGAYKNLFKDAILPVFENDNVFPHVKYTYYGYSSVLADLRYSIVWTSNRYADRYITDEFRADVETLPAEEIIRIYGTHMITGHHTGTRLDYIYRTTSVYTPEIRDWVNYYVLNYLPLGTAPRDPEIEKPLKDNIYFEFVYGTKPEPNGYMLDLLNYEGGMVRFEGINDISEQNGTFIGFSGRPYPIYEMVKDPDKKEALRQAFESYLGAEL